MALYAASISKKTLWHGVEEEFDNVYYYDGPILQFGDANFIGLLDQLVAAEKLIHGSNVTFLRGRLWSAGGTKVQNETLVLKDYTGTGTLGNLPVFKEAAVVVEWETSRQNIVGRKVYLRKFIRPCAVPTTVPDAVKYGEAAIGTDLRGPLKTYADKVQQITTATGSVIWELTSRRLRKPRSFANGVVNDMLRSREFRRN